MCRKENLVGTKSDPFAGWTKDPYDNTIRGGTLMNLSEQEIFDEHFPGFPLTMCREFVRRLFSGESAELFWDYFRRWFEKELGEEIRDILKTKKITVPENLFMGLYIGTFIETVKWWFRDGCKETPEQVERYFEEVF